MALDIDHNTIVLLVHRWLIPIHESNSKSLDSETISNVIVTSFSLALISYHLDRIKFQLFIIKIEARSGFFIFNSID